MLDLRVVVVVRRCMDLVLADAGLHSSVVALSLRLLVEAHQVLLDLTSEHLSSLLRESIRLTESLSNHLGVVPGAHHKCLILALRPHIYRDAQ